MESIQREGFEKVCFLPEAVDLQGNIKYMRQVHHTLLCARWKLHYHPIGGCKIRQRGEMENTKGI